MAQSSEYPDPIAPTPSSVAGMLAGGAHVSTPDVSDKFAGVDHATGGLIYSLWSDFKATLKTYFDAIYAAVSHTHAESDVTGLTGDLSTLAAAIALKLNIARTQVVITATTASPTAADSGKAYRLTNAVTAIFNLPASAGCVIETTCFFVEATRVVLAIVPNGADVIEHIEWDNSAPSFTYVSTNATITGYQGFYYEIRYVASGTWSISPFVSD